jgi:hypothetical protein
MTTSVTSLRNPIDDLTSKLNQPPTKPVGTIEEQLTSQRERGAVAEDVRPQVMKESLGAVETAMTDLQAKREKGATDYGTMLEKQAKDTAALEQKYTAMRPEPIEFAPSQQTPEQLQTIAVSMMLIGALAGGSAKRSGIAGLKAMKGMVDGYRQGRKDVFDREKTIFEKALDTQRQKLDEVKALYDSALRAQTAGQTAEANKFKALLEAEIAGGSMYVDIARGRNDAVNKMFDATFKAREEATKSLIEINKANEDRKLQRERMAQEAKFKERELGLRAQEIANKNVNLKPPPAEVLQANRLRSTLIPKIEQALPVIDRLAKEKSNLGVSKWAELTTLLAADPRAAEFRFKDDPEAINLILTLAYFRSKEFETAGKALTRKEDQILAPIVRGDLRVYEGIRNALVEGTKTLKQEQMSMEQSYPFISRLNAAYRGETPDQEPSKPPSNPTPPSPSPAALPKRPDGVPSNAGYSPSANAWFWKDANGVTQKKSGVQ